MTQRVNPGGSISNDTVVEPQLSIYIVTTHVHMTIFGQKRTIDVLRLYLNDPL